MLNLNSEPLNACVLYSWLYAVIDDYRYQWKNLANHREAYELSLIFYTTECIVQLSKQDEAIAWSTDLWYYAINQCIRILNHCNEPMTILPCMFRACPWVAVHHDSRSYDIIYGNRTFVSILRCISNLTNVNIEW